jgi:hypothetical protein
MGFVSLNERALGLHVINLEVEYGEVEVTLEHMAHIVVMAPPFTYRSLL